jgi:hypothetical protein
VKTSERGKARRGSVGVRRVTPCSPVRTDRMRSILGAVARWSRDQLAGFGDAARNGMEGMGAVRFSSLPDRETLCKQKPKGVTRMKQGEKGCGRSKASRG